ncbi:hypothetical protein [Burkholderia sp. S171]|uniref:hypothetical protein n=1 Tax=Burkholderia sp. S171 TaxID=1641860 RepID=UPI00131A7087|nr:hypothetical protein [Burkholderia sp. S171]
MWLFALFHAETLFGRIVKMGVCGAAVVAFYVGLTSTPPSGIQVALSLAVIAALWLHGYRESKRSSYASAQCDAEIREDEGRIRVAGGGVDFTLHLASRTLTVNKVAKRFVSTDAPGEFQRLRSGRFDWPFRALTIEPEPEPESKAGSFGTVSGASAARWTGERAIPSSDTGETTTLAGERAIGVYWKHPGQGDRLLFSVTGPVEKYEAIDRAFSIFAAWVDHEDEARHAIERRQQAEAWQRDWEAQRLAEELEHTRRRGDSPFDETDQPMRMAAKATKAARAITPSSRW